MLVVDENGIVHSVSATTRYPDTAITKRAFQNRFPLAANGISTKYDVMIQFLTDDGYAAALGVSGTPLYDLRLLIITGQNRLESSGYVDLAPTEQAAAFTYLLTQPGIPAPFAITGAERLAILTAPILDKERPI